MIDNPKLQILGCKWAKGFHSLFQDTYGLKLQANSEGFELSTKSVFEAKLGDVLVRHHELDITEKNLHAVAQKMVAQIGHDFPPTSAPLAKGIDILHGFGNLTKLDEYNARLAVDIDSSMIPFLAQQLLPFVHKEFACTRVLGVTAQVTHFQRMISLSKAIAFSADKTFEEAEIAIIKNRSGATILPYGDAVLKYMACMTIASPFALSLPFDRRGTAWHFYGNGMLFINSRSVAEGLLRSFLDSGTIRHDRGIVTSFVDFKIGSSDDNWVLHKHFIIGINNLITFIGHPKNFIESNVINFGKMARTFAAINLIFADLANMHSSSEPHNVFTFAFGLLDKLANLRVYFQNINETKRNIAETEAMKAMFTSKQKDEIIEIIGSQFKEQQGDIGSTLITMTDKAYSKLMAESKKDKFTSEDEIALLIRTMRNLQHGIFSTPTKNSEERFKTLFDGSTGAVPASLAVIAYLLVLALLFNPKKFLAFSDAKN